MTRDRRGDDTIVDAALEALKPDADRDGILPHLDELSERRVLDALTARREQMRLVSLQRRYHMAVWISAAAATVLLTAAMFFFLRGAKEQTASIPSVRAASSSALPEKDITAAIPGSRFALLFGEVSCGDKGVSTGQEIPAAERIRTKNGKIALSLPSNIAVGLFENSSARVLWDAKDSFGVSLIRGSALFSVAPKAPRKGFYVETPAGIVRVKGTLFTVTVSPEKGVFVKLHKGRVTVEKPNGETETLEGDALTALSGRQDDRTALNEAIERQLETIRVLDDGTLFTELADLKAPTTGASPEVSHRTALRQEVGRLSIQDLMSLARSRKADGDWRGAASAYTQLIRAYESSDESRTSRVSLGQIYLGHLNRPKDALREFDKYLAVEGPLSQEALWGKSLALRALGRSDLESKALRQFMQRYPGGLLAKSAALRLSELGGTVD